MKAHEPSGCPFFLKHNQTPDVKTNDPLVAINEYGNYGTAIQILTMKVVSGDATATDFELLGYALRSCGENAEAGRMYRDAIEADPNHPRANSWLQHAKDCERTARQGVSIARPMTITKEQLETDPVDLYKDHPDRWVLCGADEWQRPGDYVPPLGTKDHIANFYHATTTDALKPVGKVINTVMSEKHDAGRWTRLPKWLGGILRLAELANRREWMAERANSEDLKRGNLPGKAKPGSKRAEYAESGWTPDGSDNNSRWRYEGRVGSSVPIHGLSPDYKRVDRTKDLTLPSPALLAKDFGYRNGQIKEALTASAQAWGHLQLLVHDVMQTAPDNQVKHAAPVAPGSEEADMGIKNVHYRSDAPNATYGKDGPPMNGVTGGWDMSPIYGSSIEEVAKVRTNPRTGKACPDGKLYLEGMDANGKGGKFLPVETRADGQQQIVTGFGRNMTMPLEAEHTLYARHHNFVCDVLRERYPNWSDNQVFQIARRVVTMTYVKIHTGPWTDALFAHESVVQGLHANLYGRREWGKPVHDQKIYDPKGGKHPIADGLVSGAKYDYDVPEQKGQGFVEAYRFGHQIVPDMHYFPEIGEKTEKGKTRAVNLKDLRELDGHEFIRENGLGYCFHGLMNTRLGAPVSGNTADFFRRMDTEEGVLDMFEAEIIKDRKRGMPPYNDYCRAHNLAPLEKFDDLFKDPSSAQSQDAIAKLKAHYPNGVETLDPSLGLMLNEHRPDGFAITNVGFQTFVFEATSRIAKQELLTTKWRPEEVSWTAINLVEKINKEKLLYLHCPELREYLSSRPNPNTYEYMGTDAKSHPGEHPLQKILDYSGEHLADVGLGDPWKKEHFTGELDNYMIRVKHKPTDQVFIVDLTEGNVHFDVNGDGRVQAREVLHEDPKGVTREELLAAAQDIRKGYDIPWPGSASIAYPDFESGWRLTRKEVKTLKTADGDKEGKGVPARLTDLQVHTLIFALGDDVENARFADNKRGWSALEDSKLRAKIMAVGSTLRFGSLLSMSIPMANDKMAGRRPGKSTGIFDKNGMVNQAKLAEYRTALEQLAAKTPDGFVTKDVFMKFLKGKDALDGTTTKQWGSLFRLMNRLHGREAMRVEDFEKLYNGKLLIEAFEFFAPEEVKKKLKDAAPETGDARCPLGYG